MNPVLPLSILVPLLIAVTLAAAWMAWRSSEAASSGLRKLLLTLRVLARVAINTIFQQHNTTQYHTTQHN